ncbi:unnamed protein product [Adineta ricciae]|nr:unnamed protein product [Adineta ricciae]
MLEKQSRNSSIHEYPSETNRLNKGKNIAKGRIPISVTIGLVLTCITIALQCIAFFTPHWKEISPSAHSLYVDGVDALIRTEVLHYFNTIHRYTRHSYGLFQRCEYILSNSSVYNYQTNLVNIFRNQNGQKCTKNYLPSYNDEHFNECHSLPYYRFCTKASEKKFDVNNDYLRTAFDISSLSSSSDSKSSCECHYPPYVILCRILTIVGLLFLALTIILYICTLFCNNQHYRMKIRCFGFLTVISSVLFLLLTLIITRQHMEYESMDYLIAIQKHYRSNQIYKLSQDMKIAIDRFLESVEIRTGYSAIVAWVALVLSIVDGILLVTTCRTSNEASDDESETHMNLMSSSANEDHQFTAIPDDIQSPSTFVNHHHHEMPHKLPTLHEDEV